MADSLDDLPTGPVSDLDVSRIEPYLHNNAISSASSGSSFALKSVLAYTIAAVVFIILALPIWGNFSLMQIGIKLAVFLIALILITTYL